MDIKFLFHLLAIISTILAVAFGATSSNNKIVLIVVFMAIAAIFEIAIPFLIIPAKPDPSSQQVGTLKPKYPRTSKSSGESYTSVGMDQSSQVFTIQMSEGVIVQPLGRYAPFSISRDKNGLLISAIVHSLDGKIIAKIQDNEWVLNPNNYFRKNFDRSALEVIDEYDIPVLQVEYLDESRIKIGGIFHLEEKEISEIYPDFPSTPKDINPRAVISFRGVIMIMGKDGYLTSSRNTSPEELRMKARNIKPWFDYSKRQKLGIRK